MSTFSGFRRGIRSSPPRSRVEGETILSPLSKSPSIHSRVEGSGCHPTLFSDVMCMMHLLR